MKISALLLAVAIPLSMTLNVIIGHIWFQYKCANTLQHNIIDLSCVDLLYSHNALPYLQNTDLLTAELHDLFADDLNDLSDDTLLLSYGYLQAIKDYILFAQKVQASCPLGQNIYTIYIIHDKIINTDYIAVAKLESMHNQFRRSDFAALYSKTLCLYTIYVSQCIARISRLYLYQLYENVKQRHKGGYKPTVLQTPVVFPIQGREACLGGGIAIFYGKELY